MAEQQTVLGGRYLLRDKVGSGGMASVYRATDQVLNRTVAVKIMLPQYAGDATFAARFKQEAQAAAALSSPYIVGVYDWGKDGDTYYIVMEYLRGTDLKSGVRSHGALDPKKVAQIGVQICGALSVAHRHEIVHRDIKPQNIMVQPDGNIKVMDFGIARAKNSHLTQDNNVLGTAHYVSPEQTRGQELGPTSDIYSLGVVMYECATGKVPFDGDDAISVALKQVNEAPVPPSQINPKVDAVLERIILTCMAKDPAARFQSAEDLKNALNAYLSGRTVTVPEATRVMSAPMGASGAPDRTQTIARPMAAGNTAANPMRAAAGYDTSDDDEHSGMSKGKIAALVIGVLAVIGIAVAIFSTMFTSSSSVNVPNLLGMTEQQAKDELQKYGLTLGDTTSGYNDQYDEGQIYESTPAAGTSVEKGTSIDVSISRGAKMSTVPDLSSFTSRSDIEDALKKADLQADITEQSDSSSAGTVLSQDPEANQQVKAGTTVKVVISSGPDTTTVPDVTGMSKSDATKALSDKGFGVTYGEDYSDTVAEGNVISYDPAGKQEPGTNIKLVISLGPKPSSKVSVPSVTGMSISKAANEIAKAGFNYDIVDEEGNTVDASSKGTVISYSPSGQQEPGTTIRVVVRVDSSSSGGSGGSSDSGSGSGNNGSNSGNSGNSGTSSDTN